MDPGILKLHEQERLKIKGLRSPSRVNRGKESGRFNVGDTTRSNAEGNDGRTHVNGLRQAHWPVPRLAKHFRPTLTAATKTGSDPPASSARWVVSEAGSCSTG